LSELFRINALLPQLLAADSAERLLVQPSTDAVFSGASGPFAVTQKPDARDAYGLSKRLGERCLELGRSVVLRTSLVGPERGTTRSLLAWISTQREPVSGYTDQVWNGISTLGWARLCERALNGELHEGVHQPATEAAVSKYELLREIVETFALGVEVLPTNSAQPVDRRLVPTLVLPPIREQLEELRSWYGDGSDT
jgi:dTDP-4-dehydrorhamnose reductase